MNLGWGMPGCCIAIAASLCKKWLRPLPSYTRCSEERGEKNTLWPLCLWMCMHAMIAMPTVGTWCRYAFKIRFDIWYHMIICGQNMWEVTWCPTWSLSSCSRTRSRSFWKSKRRTPSSVMTQSHVPFVNFSMKWRRLVSLMWKSGPTRACVLMDLKACRDDHKQPEWLHYLGLW